MDSTTSRRMHGLEPLHAMIYFAAEAREEFAAHGLDNPAAGYFPARAAAMGAVTWPVVQATFFGFAPSLVEYGMAGCWDRVRPEELVLARWRAADRALRRLAGAECESPALVEAVELFRSANAALPAAGRPLYAANASLDWPEPPHLAVWHGQTLAREYRGDGHVAVLVAQGVTAAESLVLNGAYAEPGMTAFLQSTRGWAADQWQEAADALAARGWLAADGTLTSEGRAVREDIERRTDELALVMWERIGAAGAERLHHLVRPLVQAVVAGGGFPVAGGA